MADEALFTIQDAMHLHSRKARAVDAYCIKLYKLGGITPARKIAAMARRRSCSLNVGGLAVQSQLEARRARISTRARRLSQMGAADSSLA